MQVIRTGFATMAFAVAIAATPCSAQILGGPSSGSAGLGAASQQNVRSNERAAAAPKVEAPPVLPGTKSAPEAASPTMSPADMTPTEALFDAINRGDVASSRDAINRGANLDGRNMLGLTPLELSVDLGRNDISFLLLSMRGEDAAARREARGEARGGGRTGSERLRAEAPRLVRTRVVAVTPRSADEPVVATPRVSSGNGGAPIPSAGFLGFNEGRTIR